MVEVEVPKIETDATVACMQATVSDDCLANISFTPAPLLVATLSTIVLT